MHLEQGSSKSLNYILIRKINGSVVVTDQHFKSPNVLLKEHVNTDEAEASPPASLPANQRTALALCRVFRKPGYSPLGSTVYT